MEATPVSRQLSDDSGCISGSFSISSFFGSTPNDEFTTPSLPTPSTSRKRKFGQTQLNAKKLQDVIESCPSTPQFSSTLNESLLNNLENCHIRPKFTLERSGSYEEPSRNGLSNFTILESTPATPKKKIGTRDDAKKFRSGACYNLNSVNESPVKEAHDILYANIKSNVAKKTFSPLKFRESLEKFCSPAKKCLFESSERSRISGLFSAVTCNEVIMSRLFLYLSDGDLYRMSLVSMPLKQSILNDPTARMRFEIFMEVHRENKENYKVTPPRSPEKSDSPPGSPSRFNEYVKVAKLLSADQSLVKCPRCGKPSVLENSISQCQNLISCGYIHCQKCASFSETGPEDFYDRCQSSALGRISSRTRLSDMSNSRRSYISGESSSHLYSIFHSPKSNRHFEDSSGFFSENEFSPKVKRNLTQKLRTVRPQSKVFHLFNDVVSTSVPRKQRPSLAAVPVIPLNNKRIQEFEPPSPPKAKSAVACSQQSKRNLKRLTR